MHHSWPKRDNTIPGQQTSCPAQCKRTGNRFAIERSGISFPFIALQELNLDFLLQEIVWTDVPVAKSEKAAELLFSVTLDVGKVPELQVCR